MAQRSGLAGSAALMFSGTLVSRVLGLLRNALMVAAIGVTGSGAADAFSVANKLPNIIYMLLAGGILNAVLVPQVVRAMRNKDGGQEYINRLLTIAGTAMAAVTLVLTAGGGVLVSIYAADFRTGAWAPLAVAFAMWCLPQLFFYGMYTLLGQVLNARSNFGPYMWAPALNNVISIAGLVAYLIVYGSYDIGAVPAEAWDAKRIALLAAPWTLGVAMQALILIVPLYRAGFRYRPRWGLRGSGLGSAGRVAGWAFAALAAGQVGYLAISNVAAAAGTAAASSGPDGNPDPSIAGNAAYDNAFLIFMLPQSLITVSLVTALFTRLSEHAVSRHTAEVRNDLSRGLRTLSVFTIFAAGAFMALAIPLTQVIQFDQATFISYRAIGHVLVAMLIGLPAIAVWTMVQRVYFAFEDTRFLFFLQIPMALLQILGSGVSFLLLDVHHWVVGAGVATTASNTFGALVGYLALRRKLPNLDGARVLRTHLRVVVATIPSVLIGWALLHFWGLNTSFAGALARVVVLGALMAALYYVFLRRLGVSELDQLTSRVAALATPITRRLSPVTDRVVIPGRLRNMWARIVADNEGNGGSRVNRATEAVLSSGDTVADRYVVDTPVPTNLPNAVSWLGQDEILRRRIQVTILAGPHNHEALDAARRASLVRDERLQHIRRVGHHESTSYVVTDPVEAVALSAAVAAAPMPPGQARALIGHAATALETARKRGVHHLRLRPGALYLTYAAEAMVTGLAVDAAQAGTHIDDPRAAARADSVALVQLLYTALTGRWPGAREISDDLPAAPESQGLPTAPAELVDDVPADLDQLCTATLGPDLDGPCTPGELLRQLQPWDALAAPVRPPQTTALDHSSAAGGNAAAGAGDAGPGHNRAGRSATEPRSGTAVLPTPGRGIAMSGPLPAIIPPEPGGEPEPLPAPDPEPAAAPSAPTTGSPRPIPPGLGWDLPASQHESSGARPQARKAPQAPARAAAAGGARGSASQGSGASTGVGRSAAGGRSGRTGRPDRFNPTPWVILAMVAVLIAALLLAVGSLSDARTSFDPSKYANPSPSVSDTPSPEETTPSPEPSESESATPEPVELSLTDAAALDPSSGVGDNADSAGQAIDGDPDTIWRSLRYDNPSYGIKPGLGFAVDLEEPTVVTAVTIDVQGEGGLVQIRDTTADDPSAGEVLAEGPMGPEETYELSEPTELESIVLWFPELPAAESDGRNRIELAEIAATGQAE